MPLDAAGARRFYDRLGRLQDTQRVYEDPAVHRLVELGAFDAARHVLELGCGTGRLAAELLGSDLPSSATYAGLDVSETMVRLARQRLARWSDRAAVHLLEPPATSLPAADAAVDRVLATYVLDLLSLDDARALLAEARRALVPDGRLAVVSLTHGTTTPSRAVSGAWGAIAGRWPSLVGGCRPIEVRDLLAGQDWQVRHAEVVVRLGVPSEIVVATPVAGGGPGARS